MWCISGSLNRQDPKYVLHFSFLTKEKYFNYILMKYTYLRYILLLDIETWPMSLTPMIGDSGG